VSETTEQYTKTMDDYTLATRLSTTARTAESRAAFARLRAELLVSLDRLADEVLAAR
jgi:hypothetical protein